MTALQREDAARIWPHTEIEARNITFTDIDSLKAVCDEPGVVAVVAVLPQALSLKVGYLRGQNALWAEDVFTSQSEPMQAVEGQPRTFKHVGFVDSRGERV